MSFTYDVTTDRGKTRLLCTDTNSDVYLFNDAEIDAFLSMAINNDVRRAAAMALRTIAANEVLVQKRIRLLDLSTDGPAEAEALRKLAESLEDQANTEEASGTPFAIAEWVNDGFSYDEFLYKDALRNGS